MKQCIVRGPNVVERYLILHMNIFAKTSSPTLPLPYSLQTMQIRSKSLPEQKINLFFHKKFWKVQVNFYQTVVGHISLSLSLCHILWIILLTQPFSTLTVLLKQFHDLSIFVKHLHIITITTLSSSCNIYQLWLVNNTIL